MQRIKRDIIQNPTIHNNLFSTYHLNTYLNNLMKKFNFNQNNYSNNQDYLDYLSSFFCVDQKFIYYNWSADFIIKEIFQNISFKKKLIWFEKPNYKMIEIYSKIYDFKIVNSIKHANILYITFPNINKPQEYNIIKNIKDLINLIQNNKNKLIIVDFVYFNNYYSFFDLCDILNQIIQYQNVLFIFSFTKFTGNANIKQGVLITKNKILEKIILFMNPHRINNIQKYLIMNLKKEILENHRLKLIKLTEELNKLLSPFSRNGFNLFFKKNLGKFISEMNLYRFSVSERIYDEVKNNKKKNK